MLGVSAWQMRKQQEVQAFRRTAVISLVLLLLATPLNLFVGSELGVIEGTYQPMKIAAAEALWDSCPGHCAFSLAQIGGGNNDQTPTQIISIPGLLSILATNHIDGPVQGMNQLQAEDVKLYGPGDYVPNVFVQYWSMRVMAYLATLVMAFALWGAWLLYRRRLHTSRWFLRIAPWVIIVPFLINTAGWLLTESGRQPWIVQGLMKTANGVSASVSATDIWISLIVFYVIFIAFGIADAWLMIRYGRKPLDHDPIAKLTDDNPTTDAETSDEDEPALVY
jgi:cytochrome d ubiquinol oxidase subunit I